MTTPMERAWAAWRELDPMVIGPGGRYWCPKCYRYDLGNHTEDCSYSVMEDALSELEKALSGPDKAVVTVEQLADALLSMVRVGQEP